MAITINGDSGISGVDGSAATPALQGTDTNTGISFGTDEVNINTGGTTRVKVDSSGRVGIGTSTFSDARQSLIVGPASGQSSTFLAIKGSSSSANTWLFFGDSDSDSTGGILYEHSTDAMGFRTSAGERARIDSSGNLKFDSGYGSVATAYGCRAWVSFDASSGTPTIQANGNISSITDHGVGQFTFNFTNSFPDANYCVVGMTQGGTSGIGDGGECARIGDRSTTSNYMSFTDSSESTYADNKRNCVLWMR